MLDIYSWLDVPGYEGRYQILISENSVRSIQRMVIHKKSYTYIRNRILKNGCVKSGHLYVNLHISGIQKTFHIHQIVMLIKEGRRPAGMVVCHNDGNPENNHPDNLRYGTNRDNYNDLIMHGTFLHKTITQYSNIGEIIKSYISIKEAKIQTGIDSGSISRCCNGKRKTAGGFIWKFN